MAKLALFGGPKLIRTEYPSYITVGKEEKKALFKVIDRGVLSGFVASHAQGFMGGDYVQQLEKKWALRFKVKYAVSFNSATSALHGALFAVGTEPGDEVILPPSTMSGCAAVILALNAIPVFSDENPDTLCMEPANIEKNISPKTKVLMPVHLTGNICDMGRIMSIARKYKLSVIEDASQAPYGQYRDRYAGTIGDIGVYSLNCHKIIQTGEGGVAVTNSQHLAHRMRLFRNHGEKYAHFFEPKDPPLLAGLNLRMTELQAAVGIEQLKRLNSFTAHRIKLANYLTRLLRNTDGIKPITVYPGCKNVYYIYHMKYLEEKIGIKKSLFVRAAQAEGLPLYSDYCNPLYLEPIFKKLSAYGRSGCPFKCSFARKGITYFPGMCRNTESINKTSIWLDILRYPLKSKDVHLIYKCFEKIIQNKDKMRRYEKDIGCD